MATVSFEDKRKRHFNRFIDLKNEYESRFKAKHEDINDFIFPNGARFIDKEDYPTDGDRRDDEVLDNTATMAHRALVSGLYSGITSPASKWFRLTIDNPALKELDNVKQYFDAVTEIILSDLAKSNFYTSVESIYAQMIAFSTGAMQIDADVDTIFRFTPFAIGQYYIDTNDKGQVDSIYRKFSMRARNVVKMFGEENVSMTVLEKTKMPKAGNDWIEILHVQEFNTDRDVTMLDARNKPFSSTYYEFNKQEKDRPLRESGYDTQPFVAPRWSVIGTDTWGSGGPGDNAIGDVKALQVLEEDLLTALEKQVSPPVVADANSGDIAINTAAKGVTYVDGVTKGQGAVISPAYQVDINLQNLSFVIQEHQARIKSTFFADLFFLLSPSDTRQKTATEVIAAQRENLRLLGPIIERLIPEMLRPLLQRCYDLEFKAGRLPEPPEEIRDMDIKIEIISLIAQAQLLSAIAPIEQFLGFVFNAAQGDPSVLDKVNLDQAVDEVAEALGIPSGIVNSDEIVQQIRTLQAQQLAIQQQQQNAAQSASTAKDLSQTDVSGDNALTAVVGGLQGAA